MTQNTWTAIIAAIIVALIVLLPQRAGRHPGADATAPAGQSFATKGFDRVPIWSISISHRCPAVIGPTPAGVPPTSGAGSGAGTPGTGRLA